MRVVGHPRGGPGGIAVETFNAHLLSFVAGRLEMGIRAIPWVTGTELGYPDEVVLAG